MATLSGIIVVLSVLASLQERPAIPVLVEQALQEGLQDAQRLVLSPQGWLYVTETRSNTIALIVSPGKDVRRVGGFGWRETTFDGPSGVSTDGLNVLVSDRENHRVQRFDRNLNYIATLATRDTINPQIRFGFPEGVALSRQGDLYVLDGEQLRVVKFGVTGLFERTFGASERPEARLRAPRDIVVTPDERVLVLEQDRLVEFDAFGNFVRLVGEGTLAGATGFSATDSNTVVVSPDTVYWFDSNGGLAWRIGRTAIVANPPLGTLQDVAVAGQTLYLLTPGAVRIFLVE